MKIVLTSLTFFLVIVCNAQKKVTSLGKTAFQQKLNSQFKDPEKSPLTKRDLKKFKALNFYPVNAKYKVVANLVKTPNAEVFKFPTTTDRIALYQKYGELYFTINGKNLKLDVFKSVNNYGNSEKYKHHLFLPFTDKTCSKTSYKGGRFIDLLTLDEKNGTIVIDFNKAYNPYCAYSNRYSCPIVPKQNHLDVKIEAGVMAYKKH